MQGKKIKFYLLGNHVVVWKVFDEFEPIKSKIDSFVWNKDIQFLTINLIGKDTKTVHVNKDHILSIEIEDYVERS